MCVVRACAERWASDLVRMTKEPLLIRPDGVAQGEARGDSEEDTHVVRHLESEGRQRTDEGGGAQDRRVREVERSRSRGSLFEGAREGERESVIAVCTRGEMLGKALTTPSIAKKPMMRRKHASANTASLCMTTSHVDGTGAGSFPSSSSPSLPLSGPRRWASSSGARYDSHSAKSARQKRAASERA